MEKKRVVAIDWNDKVADPGSAIKRFASYLKSRGFRTSSIDGYLVCAKGYLMFSGTDRPTQADAIKFRETLLEKNLARSTLNNYSFAIKCYHKMHGEEFSLPFLKRNEDLPYYFSEDDVQRIFDACRNLKHLAMLKTMFYGCLRVSELTHLEDRDLDLDSLTIRVRQGKGGRDGNVCITDDCALTLKRYLAIRPSLEIDGQYPLFYTDFGNRWDRRDVYRMFVDIKRRAGIEKRGGPHVFARHTSATLMIANGCDIRIVQELLRHRDIRTTTRYAHVSDATKRRRYTECMNLCN